MQFRRLRLHGFKTFVDPADLRIELGLTGVVGPNGCGKSNLVEALRWVMGASSAKALRGRGMDDVIFNGSDARPARNLAEVGLVIDNTARTAPPTFNDADQLEITRRITRGGGSTYRVNGREARARDVQRLFADVSSGANSPALVRQGQVNELIAAKPENRRRVLEDAAGVAGLRSRRHEALLKLNGASANLERLDDARREAANRLVQLKRQAKQAELYKTLAAEIRALEAELHRRRLVEADAQDAAAQSALQAAQTDAETMAREAARARVAAQDAQDALAAPHEEETLAAAILARAEAALEAAEQEAQAAQAETERLSARLAELDADLDRERRLAEEAETAKARAERDLAELRIQPHDDAAQRDVLVQRAQACEQVRQSADETVERLAAERAALSAERRGLSQTLTDLQARAERLATARASAEKERAGLNLDAARAGFTRTRADAESARAAFVAAETAIAEADAAFEAAENAARARTEDASAAARRLAEIESEMKGLERALAPNAQRTVAPVLDQLTVEPGYERALAAALGADAQAGLDPAAGPAWTGARTPDQALPANLTPLSAHVRGPQALCARLSQIGVGPQDALDAIDLAPGQRAVTVEGQLKRWDGFVSDGQDGSARETARRLETRNRLEGLRRDADAAQTDAAAAQSAREAAQVAMKAAREGRETARAADRQARARLAQAEREDAQAERALAQIEARGEVLETECARLGAESEDLARQEANAQARLDALAEDAQGARALDDARAHAQTARREAEAARAALNEFDRRVSARRARRDRLQAEARDWSRRTEQASGQVTALSKRRAQTLAAAETARAAPQAAEEKRDRLEQERLVAARRREAAGVAVKDRAAAAERADAQARAAESDAAKAQAALAGAQARREAARNRLEERLAQGLELTGLSRDQLCALEPLDGETAGLEHRLDRARGERDGLGAVNLQADEDAEAQAERLTAIDAERADLDAAVNKLREAVEELNQEGRKRLRAAMSAVDEHFRALFATLFGGGEARLELVEAEDPLDAGLEIIASPPGKRPATLSLLSGGEQALTASALIFAVFLTRPSPLCVLDEVDAPLDDANVDRFCRLLDEMRRRSDTRFLVITHHPVTMARMDRLYGVTMAEKGVSQLVSVDLRRAEALAAAL